jgi:hypothetical protein
VRERRRAACALRQRGEGAQACRPAGRAPDRAAAGRRWGCAARSARRRRRGKAGRWQPRWPAARDAPTESATCEPAARAARAARASRPRAACTLGRIPCALSRIPRARGCGAPRLGRGAVAQSESRERVAVLNHYVDERRGCRVSAAAAGAVVCAVHGGALPVACCVLVWPRARKRYAPTALLGYGFRHVAARSAAGCRAPLCAAAAPHRSSRRAQAAAAAAVAKDAHVEAAQGGLAVVRSHALAAHRAAHERHRR